MQHTHNLSAPIGAAEELPILIPPAMLADVLGVTAECVRDNIHRGALPGAKVCGRLYVKRDEFLQMLGGSTWTE